MESQEHHLNHLSEENQTFAEISLRRHRLRRLDPDLLTPILLPPCEVDVLLVADGSIFFDDSDFGLETFIEALLSPPGPYVEFNISLAHLRDSVRDRQMLDGHSGISRRIKGFKFDDTDDFTPEMYDQVWLFGIRSGGYNRGSGYPADRLSDTELRALSEFMDGGGGVFATGDHGALGKALSATVPRVRSMRRWDNSSGEVAMTDSRRNDTNRSGANTSSEFNDQSDDVPQPIQPKMYYQQRGIWRYSYPHPLLCGPDGTIRVMPDHPHEGECIEPSSTGRSFTFDGYTIDEYPPGSGSSPQPLPEVISTSSVPAGNDASVKDPTDAQEFGGICAYDGHQASVGRVVTDATWHHFLNINLVGDSGISNAKVKGQGFLASASGQDHFDNIKSYYRNIAVWLSRPSQIHCMNHRTIWDLLWHHRVIEAVSTRPDVTFEMADASYIYDVGQHARDVLGNYASQCQSRRIPIDILRPQLDDRLLDRLDPWRAFSEEAPDQDSLPWTSVEPLLDIGLGGALIALREEFREPDPDVRDEAQEAIEEVVSHGVEQALEMARQNATASAERFASLWDEGGKIDQRG